MSLISSQGKGIPVLLPHLASQFRRSGSLHEMPKMRKLSNILVIRDMMTDPLLTKNAKIVGVAIAMRRNLKTLICCPSQKILSVDCAIKDPKQIRCVT